MSAATSPVPFAGLTRWSWAHLRRAARRLRSAWPLLLAGLVLALLVGWLFQPGLSGGFIFDDTANIAENVSLHMTGLDHVSALRAANSFPYGPGLRQLPMLSFGLDYFRAGSFDPAVYKTTNLLIHLVTMLVLAGFLRQLLCLAGEQGRRAGLLATAAAVLWAIHPLQVSSVLYVVQRMQTMASLFLLMALWAYLHMRQAQIAGRPWVRAAALVLGGWLLALASKEDAALLPAYTLLLELTVLRFAMRAPAAGCWLARGYVLVMVLGAALFAFWAMPRYGSLDTFPGRDFNSAERVLSQGRVLLMYIGQILWPAPGNLPFYYDNYVVSRSWLSPPSTLYAWLVCALLVLAALWGRHVRPLMALGVLWFFAGHVVTSNVLGLELAFEHRNHFPMIGLVLVLVDCVRLLLASRPIARWLGVGVLALVLLGCALATHNRAAIWGNELAFARSSAMHAPQSGRAWVELCRAEHAASGNDIHSAGYARAVDACLQGGLQGGSALALNNMILLKSARGDLGKSDWDLLHQRLSSMPMTPENHHLVAGLIGNAGNGLALDPASVLKTVDIIAGRGALSVSDAALVAVYRAQVGAMPADKRLAAPDAGHIQTQAPQQVLHPQAGDSGQTGIK